MLLKSSSSFYLLILRINSRLNLPISIQVAPPPPPVQNSVPKTLLLKTLNYLRNPPFQTTEPHFFFFFFCISKPNFLQILLNFSSWVTSFSKNVFSRPQFQAQNSVPKTLLLKTLNYLRTPLREIVVQQQTSAYYAWHKYYVDMIINNQWSRYLVFKASQLDLLFP